MRACEVDGCDRVHKARGLCKPHLNRWYRNGTPTAVRGCHLDFAPLDGGQAAGVAERHGVSVRSIHRWRSAGIPRFTAERLAERLGMHPCELWPLFYRLTDPSDPNQGSAA